MTQMKVNFFQNFLIILHISLHYYITIMVDITFYTENTSKMKTNFSRSSQSKGEEFIKKSTFNIKIDIKKNTK